MDKKTWEQFSGIKKKYCNEIQKMHKKLPYLQALQQKLVDGRSSSYKIETPVVYNSSLDDINPESEIKLILVADNPGRREQAAENRRYLVGPSGKIAGNFFKNNPSLGIDFQKNVIILNKTPVHSPRTIELRELCRIGDSSLETELAESQKFMARLLLEFHMAFTDSGKKSGLPVWIIGYSEMKRGGLFETYTNELKIIYSETSLKDSVFLFRHFSMNQFTIDLKQQAAKGETVKKTLERIGTAYRKRFLW